MLIECLALVAKGGCTTGPQGIVSTLDHSFKAFCLTHMDKHTMTGKMRRQKNMFQHKIQGKSEEDRKETKISDLPDKEFKSYGHKNAHCS